jgi:choline dehydrogenase-like flavoprotein
MLARAAPRYRSSDGVRVVIEDGRGLPPDTLVEADVAIIGAGAAGITIARELAGTSVNVCLLESGNFDFDPETQSLYKGEIAGRWYFPLDASRLRYFGGSTNHWGGWCRPLAPIDFEARDWLPYSGWPITREELDPYYERAQPITETGPYRYDSVEFWEKQTGQSVLPFRGGTITTRFFQYSPPTRFGTRYRDDIAGAANIRALLHANVTEIEAGEQASTVTGLSVRSIGGSPFTVRARLYVLAAGGIENARILLLSRSVQPSGLGNTHDLVGRFFMEHPHLPMAATLMTSRPSAYSSLYTRHLIRAGTTVHATLVPTEDFMRRERLLNAGFTVGVMRGYTAGELAQPPGDDDFNGWDVLQLERDLAPVDDVPGRVDEEARSGDDDWPPAGMEAARMALGGACEQAPNPESRVMLSTERDALGLDRAKLDWRLTETDKLSLNRVIDAIGREVGMLGVGRLRPSLSNDGVWPERVEGGNHHMGTTRMSDQPTSGVVDRNCRVHGIANLYIAGSSVFPTCGASNPTLTIVALALRLADRIKAQLS